MLDGGTFGDHLLDQIKRSIGMALKPQPTNQGDLRFQPLVVMKPDDVRPLRRRRVALKHLLDLSARVDEIPQIVQGFPAHPLPDHPIL
jgi:hypothetical protein